MSYSPLEELKNAWIFKHKSLPISEQDLACIKPLNKQRANVLWDTLISKQVDHPDFFKKGDWPANKNSWLEQAQWEKTWDSDEPQLPTIILEHLAWENNTVVYFCVSRHIIIESNWAVFQRCWKNFLFMSDGPILLGKKRQQSVQFSPNGFFKIG